MISRSTRSQLRLESLKSSRTPPPPQRPRILQLNAPPQHLPRPIPLPPTLQRARQPKPRLAGIPPVGVPPRRPEQQQRAVAGGAAVEVRGVGVAAILLRPGPSQPARRRPRRCRG